MNPQNDQTPTNPTNNQFNSNSQPGPSQNPSNQQSGDQPQVVYMARPLEPQRQSMSPEIRQKHEESKRLYPKLNLSEGEYVISSVKRHPIGGISIWFSTFAVIAAIFAAVIILSRLSSNSNFGGSPIPMNIIVIPAVLLSLLILLFGFVSSMIYNANRFYLTNESVIQHIQTSLFSVREQTISLGSVEDASYSQDGILSHIFNYGKIRLSTMGDETTYGYTFASEPSKQIAILNNAVEDFKNIRPVED